MPARTHICLRVGIAFATEAKIKRVPLAPLPSSPYVRVVEDWPYRPAARF